MIFVQLQFDTLHIEPLEISCGGYAEGYQGICMSCYSKTDNQL